MTFSLTDLPARWACKITITESGCWQWTGAVQSKGYASIANGRGGSMLGHRASYKLLVGEIPAGLTLDHTCHNTDQTCVRGRECQHRRCMNPAHLEPVTQTENADRARSLDVRIEGDPIRITQLPRCPTPIEMYGAERWASMQDAMNKLSDYLWPAGRGRPLTST